MKSISKASLLVGVGIFIGIFYVGIPVSALRKAAEGLAAQNGDSNGDGTIDIADAVYLLLYLFKDGNPPVAIADAPEVVNRLAALEASVIALQGQLNQVASGSMANLNCQPGEIPKWDGSKWTCAEDEKSGDQSLTSEMAEVLSHLNMVNLDNGQGETTKTIRITNANLQLVNGTNNTRTANGTGNLIVGYQEPCHPSLPDNRTGSHNIVVGTGNNYSGHGGIVTGACNAISGQFPVVIGGAGNKSEGELTVVIGGTSNNALNGGSVVIGGADNNARGPHSTVCGGFQNEAKDLYSVASGGQKNSAIGSMSAVYGGVYNVASGDRACVIGGDTNIASGNFSTVTGGSDNKAEGTSSVVGGGRVNVARGVVSVISGGSERSVDGPYDWRAGDLFQDQ